MAICLSALVIPAVVKDLVSRRAELHLYRKAEASIQALAFSPDGRWFAWLELDDTAPHVVLETENQQETIGFPQRRGSAKCLAFSPDSDVLAVGFNDGVVELWDVEMRSLRLAFPTHTDGVRALAFSPDAAVLATGGSDAKVRLWDSSTATLRSTLTRHRNAVNSVAFAPDGGTFASADVVGEVVLWSWRDARVIAVPRWDGAAIYPTTLAFSPDGKTLATGGVNGQVVLCDVNAGIYVSAIGDRHSMVTSIAWAPDGRTIASARVNGAIECREISTGRCRNVLREHRGPVWALAFSPDGKQLASGGSDQSIRLWPRDECAPDSDAAAEALAARQNSHRPGWPLALSGLAGEPGGNP